MYTIQLSQLDGNTDLLGSRTSVDIIISKNDDANGVFLFAQDSLQISIGMPLCIHIVTMVIASIL